MSKLTLANENILIAAVIQVITLRQEGIPFAEALEKANITRRQYYYWINHAEETIEVFYSMIDQSQRRELEGILSEREYLLSEAIRKAKEPRASIYDILSVVSYMDKRQDEIETRQGVTDNAELKAKQYLSGPITKIQSSRLSASAQSNEDGTVTVQIRSNPDIIESGFLPEQQLEQVPNLESDQLDPFERPSDLDLPLD